MDENREFDKIINAEISETMRSSYIDYAMSVIVARALPDVRDGLKPVHRRILYSMNEMGLAPNKAHKKSARITGDTMGKYHPHGDAAIYDALVRLAQDFSMRYPLVDGHGNFGSIDGYPAAAARYTEARLSRISMEMLADIDKDTVDFVPNYDGDFMEPTVLPSRIPNLLVNGATGIAVGMATNIPPHNLSEVINAIVRIIDNRVEEGRETDIDEICHYIKGPDFPTGGNILGRNGIMSAYKTGRGKLKVRAQAEIITKPNGREEILITEIPYAVNKSRMITGIADLVKEKKIEGISGIQDSTNDRNGIHILIEVKKDASAEIVLNNLYKYSQLQETYSVNLLAIVDGVPQVLNIKQMLELYLKHQEEVITRRTRFDLKKALERLHILEGFLKALDNIDEVISILRSSRTTPEAKERLVERFGFTELQVNAICEMRLRALVGMEREKLQNEFAELTKFAEEMRAILADENKLFGVIKSELLEIKNKFGDERLTRLVQDMGEIDIEDLIEDEMSVITMTHLNYIKRIPLSTYKSQNRGGKGIIGMQTREEDAVKDLFLSSNHSYLLFFTNMGKVYRIKTWEIPEAGRNAKGTPIINVLEMGENEKITAVIQAKDFSDDSGYLMMITKSGVIKKTPVNMFNNIRRSGLIAVNLRDNDELISVQKTDGNMDIFVVTHYGMAIRFNENDLRSLGRTAAGVKAISLNDGDSVIGAEIISKDKKVLIVSEKGYGKCTESDSFKVQNRGGKGLKAYKITEKTGNIIGLAMVNDNEELIMVTSQGVIIRIRIRDISTVGRVTQGVKLINVGDDVTVVSMAKISEEDIEEETAEIEENTEE
ncbi:MAG: DNA gyrase subunit A [Firmicutes bacterium]|nr:DNA gyrase subunit A [Bacillota bacterium]